MNPFFVLFFKNADSNYGYFSQHYFIVILDIGVCIGRGKRVMDMG